MSKVYLLPVDRLNLDDLRKAFKKAKADARGKKSEDVQQVSDSETPK